MGHTRIIVKADNEPSIQALAHRAIVLAKIELKDMEQVSKEDPVAYDSMTNGGTEVGVRLLRGLFRSVKLCLEARINMEIPVGHPMIAWMMEHASLILNALVRVLTASPHGRGYAVDHLDSPLWESARASCTSIPRRGLTTILRGTWEHKVAKACLSGTIA